ncbi:MAG TPA: hypothetical protein DCP57_03855 [Gammaproteobacteria bacterium]|nr:MAG: hypothetical protein CBC94_002080 [Gammaproteobacteria bacterium TMED134]RPG48281.1 MAG: hypothetical protein CBC94_000635 [Gammaproteobacteria bacterium TMED134]RZO70921.1 MAG: hypothetical protein EVA67_06565 [OM182 bacterium]HAL41556.1 hypothetical protein [Gammaproteobacteria bacterium]HBK18356.1 hypothetical protein [Gammaproteobacteria bacterium]
MLAFAGSLDLPAIAMILGPILAVLLGSGFVWRRFCLLSNRLMIDLGIAYLVIGAIGILYDTNGLYSFHFIAALALLPLLYGLLLKLPFHMLSRDYQALAEPPPLAFRVGALIMIIGILTAAALMTAPASAYLSTIAIVFILLGVLIISSLSRLRPSASFSADLISYLPAVGLTGLGLSGATALQDLYELDSLASILTLGCLALLYSVFLKILLTIAFPTVEPDETVLNDFGRLTLSLMLLGAALYMAFVSLELSTG